MLPAQCRAREQALDPGIALLLRRAPLCLALSEEGLTGKSTAGRLTPDRRLREARQRVRSAPTGHADGALVGELKYGPVALGANVAARLTAPGIRLSSELHAALPKVSEPAKRSSGVGTYAPATAPRSGSIRRTPADCVKPSTVGDSRRTSIAACPLKWRRSSFPLQTQSRPSLRFRPIYGHLRSPGTAQPWHCPDSCRQSE